MTIPERRETVRFAVTARTEVYLADTAVQLTLVDLSMGGFSARSSEPVPVGVVMRFRFAKPNGGWEVVLAAESVYSAATPGASGMAFLSGFKFQHSEQTDVQIRILSLVDHATSVVTFS